MIRRPILATHLLSQHLRRQRRSNSSFRRSHTLFPYSDGSP